MTKIKRSGRREKNPTLNRYKRAFHNTRHGWMLGHPGFRVATRCYFKKQDLEERISELLVPTLNKKEL